MEHVGRCKPKKKKQTPKKKYSDNLVCMTHTGEMTIGNPFIFSGKPEDLTSFGSKHLQILQRWLTSANVSRELPTSRSFVLIRNHISLVFSHCLCVKDMQGFKKYGPCTL